MIIDSHNHLGIELVNWIRGDYPYAQSLEDLRAKAVGSGVTHWVAFPFPSYARSAPEITPLDEVDLSAIPYEHSNRQLLREVDEYFPQEPRMVLPFAILDPSRQPEAQTGVLRALRQRHRIFGLKIQGTIIQSPVNALLREGECFLDLAAEWDVPFVIHSSIHPDDLWSQCADILEVAIARPDVRFVLAHSCRFHRPSLEKVMELPNTWFDCSAHRIHCDLAAKDSPAVAASRDRFATDYRDPSQVLCDLAEHYGKKLVWGTDSPYHSWASRSGDLPEELFSSYPLEWECVEALDLADRKRVTCDNTLHWLGLDENGI